MDITIEKKIIIEEEVIKGCKKVESINDIDVNDRLFYELGYYNKTSKYYSIEDFKPENWRRTGEFKEVTDIKEFLEMETRLNVKEFLDHHNFVILKRK